MTPQEALQRQIEGYRRITGEQRLKIALALHELSCDVARSGIRHQFPEADEQEVEHRLRDRLRLAREMSRVGPAKRRPTIAEADGV